jgi:hypothetical protein
MNITQPQIRTTTYQKSFFPQSINDWNSLSKPIREINSMTGFKDHQKKYSGYKCNRLYHHNCSRAAVNHTRLRLGLSGLASQRYDYKHINNPECVYCGALKEDLTHYFLLCPTFSPHRPRNM